MGASEILAIAGGVVLLYNAGTALYKLMRPAIDLKTRIDKHEKKISELRSFTDRDYEALKANVEAHKALCGGLVSILNHMIDGNHTETMKDTRDELLEFMQKI